MREGVLLGLLAVFVPFSLIAFGGGSSIMAGIQHQAVDVRGWLTAREFIDFFAIARAAPGPGTMLVTLIGWHVAGIWGALVATLALFVPSSLLCFFVVRIWNRHRGRRWHTALERGLAPVGAGLLLASVISLVRITDPTWLGFAVMAASAVAAILVPRLQPVLLLLCGAVIFQVLL